MTTLILTVVGSDRPGLVATVAHIVEEHGGNWENSRLAELDGTFAGVIQISVPIDRVEELRASLHGLDGLLTIAVHPGTPARPPPRRAASCRSRCSATTGPASCATSRRC